MSMHKVPLTALEEAGLMAHRLPVGVPSQLSDSFRHGIAYATAAESGKRQIAREALAAAWSGLPEAIRLQPEVASAFQAALSI